MKIAIIGPGLLPIPPVGWGAVEILIHEYRIELEKNGWDVLIVNTRSAFKIVRQINAFRPDFVHCHYEDFIGVLDFVDCPHRAFTSHFGYLDQIEKFPKHRALHAAALRSKKLFIFALSPSIADMYRREGVDDSRLFVIPNGVRFDRFRFAEVPLLAARSLCLGRIDARKKQGLLQSYDAAIDFAGNLCKDSAGFDSQRPDYLGEWNREQVYDRLTDYANLVLLSDGEAHPLVCLEAMAAGLGLVLSRPAAANLDLSLPFIDVVPDDKIGDGDYVRRIVTGNRAASVMRRQEIRAYARQFDWPVIVGRYMSIIDSLVAAGEAKPIRASGSDALRSCAEYLSLCGRSPAVFLYPAFVEFYSAVGRRFPRLSVAMRRTRRFGFYPIRFFREEDFRQRAASAIRMHSRNALHSLLGRMRPQPFTIVCGADASHGKSLAQLVASILRHEPDVKLYVYDLGLTQAQRREIDKIAPQAIVRVFDYARYPAWFDIRTEAGQYAWKPVIIEEVVNESSGPVLWLDAGNLVTGGLHQIYFRAQRDGFYSPHSDGDMEKWTHEAALAYFGLNKAWALGRRNVNGACVAFNPSHEKGMALCREWSRYAQIREAIAPPGSSRQNHRQDQALLGILAHRAGMINNDPEFYVGFETQHDIG